VDLNYLFLSRLESFPFTFCVYFGLSICFHLVLNVLALSFYRTHSLYSADLSRVLSYRSFQKLSIASCYFLYFLVVA